MKVGLYLRKFGRSLHQARHSTDLRTRGSSARTVWKRSGSALRARSGPLGRLTRAGAPALRMESAVAFSIAIVVRRGAGIGRGLRAYALVTDGGSASAHLAPAPVAQGGPRPRPRTGRPDRSAA
jgi:hypothetical protein